MAFKPLQSLSRINGEMATGDMLQEMVFYNERSSSINSPLLYTVELGHQDQCNTLTPSTSQTLKRSHWRNITKADRCFDSRCHSKLSLLVKKRNCCMCGEVFCHKCSSFRRKLSPDATPDPSFGVLCHVCNNCFDIEVDDTSNSYNWTDWFDGIRRRRKLSIRQKEEDSLSMPIPALNTQANARMKRERVLQEIDRLTIGFSGSSNWMKSLVSTPAWHKSPNWAEPSRSHQCFNCHTSFKVTLKKIISKKVNCRVCGQVYCPACTREEIIIFLSDSRSTSAKWAINGKAGTPTSSPYSCTLLQVCTICVKELEEILIDELEAAEEEVDIEEEKDLIDSLSRLQICLYHIKARIEVWLPQYQKLVDLMEVSDSISQSKGPIGDLARSQSNLSDKFSQLAIESQKLRKLEPLTPTQEKVLKNVTIATYKFYSDSMYLFRMTRYRLAELMPIESIERIQQALNQISIERVHIIVRQITFEAMNLEIRYKLIGYTITEHLVNCIEALEEEAEIYFTKIGENWGNHARAVSRMVQEDFEGSNPQAKKYRRIKVSEQIGKKHFRNVIIQFKILSQCSNYLRESIRELNAKTPESCFVDTKGIIQTVNDQFGKELALLKKHHPQVFAKTTM